METLEIAPAAVRALDVASARGQAQLGLSLGLSHSPESCQRTPAEEAAAQLLQRGRRRRRVHTARSHAGPAGSCGGLCLGRSGLGLPPVSRGGSWRSWRMWLILKTQWSRRILREIRTPRALRRQARVEGLACCPGPYGERGASELLLERADLCATQVQGRDRRLERPALLEAAALLQHRLPRRRQSRERAAPFPGCAAPTPCSLHREYR